MHVLHLAHREKETITLVTVLLLHTNMLSIYSVYYMPSLQLKEGVMFYIFLIVVKSHKKTNNTERLLMSIV